MRVIRAIRQRFEDAARERRIRFLRAEACRLLPTDKCGSRAMYELMFHECEQRSPGQVARLERAHLDSLDPHARDTFERRRS